MVLGIPIRVPSLTDSVRLYITGVDVGVGVGVGVGLGISVGVGVGVGVGVDVGDGCGLGIGLLSELSIITTPLTTAAIAIIRRIMSTKVITHPLFSGLLVLTFSVFSFAGFCPQFEQ